MKKLLHLLCLYAFLYTEHIQARPSTSQRQPLKKIQTPSQLGSRFTKLQPTMLPGSTQNPAQDFLSQALADSQQLLALVQQPTSGPVLTLPGSTQSSFSTLLSQALTDSERLLSLVQNTQTDLPEKEDVDDSKSTADSRRVRFNDTPDIYEFDPASPVQQQPAQTSPVHQVVDDYSRTIQNITRIEDLPFALNDATLEQLQSMLRQQNISQDLKLQISAKLRETLTINNQMAQGPGAGSYQPPVLPAQARPDDRPITGVDNNLDIWTGRDGSDDWGPFEEAPARTPRQPADPFADLFDNQGRAITDTPATAPTLPAARPAHAPVNPAQNQTTSQTPMIPAPRPTIKVTRIEDLPYSLATATRAELQDMLENNVSGYTIDRSLFSIIGRRLVEIQRPQTPATTPTVPATRPGPQQTTPAPTPTVPAPGTPAQTPTVPRQPSLPTIPENDSDDENDEDDFEPQTLATTPTVPAPTGTRAQTPTTPATNPLPTIPKEDDRDALDNTNPPTTAADAQRLEDFLRDHDQTPDISHEIPGLMLEGTRPRLDEKQNPALAGLSIIPGAALPQTNQATQSALAVRPLDTLSAPAVQAAAQKYNVPEQDLSNIAQALATFDLNFDALPTLTQPRLTNLYRTQMRATHPDSRQKTITSQAEATANAADVNAARDIIANFLRGTTKDQRNIIQALEFAQTQTTDATVHPSITNNQTGLMLNDDDTISPEDDDQDQDPFAATLPALVGQTQLDGVLASSTAPARTPLIDPGVARAVGLSSDDIAAASRGGAAGGGGASSSTSSQTMPGAAAGGGSMFSRAIASAAQTDVKIASIRKNIIESESILAQMPARELSLEGKRNFASTIQGQKIDLLNLGVAQNDLPQTPTADRYVPFAPSRG